MISAGRLVTLASAAAIVSALGLGFGTPLFAEDLSDNETCLECHEGEERDPPSDPNRPQVHNPEGGFFVEDHEMWSCIDCHDYITEIPHPEDLGDPEVNCENCHDTTPTK